MTMEEAKNLYIKYDCSLFGMAREEKDSYEAFQALNISKVVLDNWRQELFDTLWIELRKTGEISIFTKMAYLSENVHNLERLNIMRSALEYIEYKDLKTKAYVSETLLGRKDIPVRSGMVFWAYDIGEQEVAKELLKYVMELLNSEENDENIKTRIKRDMERCYKLDSFLKLGIYNTV